MWYRNRHRWPCIVAGTLLTLTSSQGADFFIPSDYVKWNETTYTLTSSRLIQGQYQSRIPQMNGYIGLAQASIGPLFEADVRIPGLENEEPPVNTWPLFNKRQTFATISGFWNSMESGESSIAGIPHFTDLLLEVCGTPLNAAVDENSIWDFQTSMSFKTGLATWVFKWSPVGCTRKVDLDVRFEVFLSSDARQVAATKLSITASRDCNAIVTDLLDGRGAVRSTVTKKGLDAGAATIYAEVKPYGMEDVVAFLVSSVEFTSPGVDHASRRDASALTYIESHDATVGQTYDVRLTALSEMTVFKYVGIASSDHFPDPEATARNASSSAAAIGWSKLLDAHILVVRKIMHPDLLADFARPDGSLPSNDLIRNMHIIAKTSAFYLWHNLLPTNGSQQNYTSISVGGLSSDSYAGKIFWDADIFMAPGIMASHPSLAKQIAQYRISRAPQAARNAEALGYTPGSLIYPWTSSRLGECFDGSAKCAGYQYHLNTDIALSLVMLRNVSGDTKWFRDEALPVIDGIAQMLEQLVEYNGLTGRWEVHGMTEPDEFYGNVNNGAFTAASISKVMEIASNFRGGSGLKIPPTWDSIAAAMEIPYSDSGIILEFEGFEDTSVIKQADVILMDYPLNYQRNFSDAQRLAVMDYYTLRQSPNGPAMTWSIYAISANMLSTSGCQSWTYAVRSFEPYARAPWYQFSEQQLDDYYQNGYMHPGFPFLTGHGGFLQVLTAGFLGVRVLDTNLVINPSLPPQLSFFKPPIQFYNGAVIKSTMNSTHTNITRLPPSLYDSRITDNYANTTMPVTVGTSVENGTTYHIHLHQTLTIPNRRPYTKPTQPGNILQCLAAYSDAAFLPGQYPFAAIDGSSATSWQPQSQSPAALIINTTSIPSTPIAALTLDFGNRPPRTITVLLSDDPEFVHGITSIRFKGLISRPYEAEEAKVVIPYRGNETVVDLRKARVWSRRFVKVVIEGCLAGDGIGGATVAEFRIVGAGQWEDVFRMRGSGQIVLQQESGQEDAPTTGESEKVILQPKTFQGDVRYQ